MSEKQIKLSPAAKSWDKMKWVEVGRTLWSDSEARTGEETRRKKMKMRKAERDRTVADMAVAKANQRQDLRWKKGKLWPSSWLHWLAWLWFACRRLLFGPHPQDAAATGGTQDADLGKGKRQRKTKEMTNDWYRGTNFRLHFTLWVNTQPQVFFLFFFFSFFFFKECFGWK